MKKLHLQATLMVITILAITGFQLFWLKQSYEREQRSLTLKTDFAFRDAIQELQVLKFKLEKFTKDTSITKVKMLLNHTEDSMKVTMNGKRGIISTINVMRRRSGDTLWKDSGLKKGVLIAKDQTFFDRKLDLPGLPENKDGKITEDHVFEVLYGVDSLQDSLKIPEIIKTVNQRFNSQLINVPFTVSRSDSMIRPGRENINEVTVGFAHPVTYKFKLGNAFPYLIRQIALPILFSLLLLGITILSFVLLYRNLLQQRKLTEIKNEFISNITHELKTPISTVSVAIEAIKNFDALHNPERTQEYLGIAGLELNRLSLLVDKVLRLSMFENREVQLVYESFNFAELLKEVTDSMQLQFEKANAKVTTQFNGTDFIIEADKMHITSVVYNLLDNAIKYSREDPQINISTTTIGGEMILSIADNGIGIDPAYRDKIFDKFFRVPHGDRHNVKGYGLGLSYAAHIITKHKGTIEARSDGKSGTEFIIKIPVKHGS